MAFVKKVKGVREKIDYLSNISRIDVCGTKKEIGLAIYTDRMASSIGYTGDDVCLYLYVTFQYLKNYFDCYPDSEYVSKGYIGKHLGNVLDGTDGSIIVDRRNEWKLSDTSPETLEYLFCEL